MTISQRHSYTFNGNGKSASVIDSSGTVVATIPLGAKPEAGVPDPAAGRVYVNNETGNEIIVIDAAKHEVVAKWPIAPGESAAGATRSRRAAPERRPSRTRMPRTS